MSIVTDSSGERPENVYQIHKLLKSESELAGLYEEHKGKYQALKEALIADMIAFIKPLRERRKEIAKDPEAVIKIIKEGNEQAKAVAQAKMLDIKQKVGLDL
jgi:tryptophanyl-tRNA synthetase